MTTKSSAPSVPAQRGTQGASTLHPGYLEKFEEDTLRHRPLWIRLIIEYLGTTLLVLVAADPA